MIRPKKFGDDSTTPADQSNKVADKIIEEPRKVWVKLKSSGDLVEINLDRDKPEKYEICISFVGIVIILNLLSCSTPSSIFTSGGRAALRRSSGS